MLSSYYDDDCDEQDRPLRQHPLIVTKFQRPTLGPDILPRPHLINRLEEGQHRQLTLISAPAGYGKSILVSAWADTIDRPVAWLSLDKKDNDPRTFLLYFIGAVQTIFPEAYLETQALLNGSQLPPADYLASSLTNETSAFPQPFQLVLDDFHHLDHPQIHQVMAGLTHYRPAQLHLVIVTRQDPQLDLYNLRAKNLLTELRLNDLRFSQDEVQQFCAQKLENPLSAELVAQLTQRTEGWAAGLRLACLAMRPLDDYAQFLHNFQGTNQFIMGYLIEEVLARQEPSLQSFLLCTSLLDRFSPALADALLMAIPPDIGESARPYPSSAQVIEQIKERNLFLIALDQEGLWYRYHNLFQELLRYRLQKEWNLAQIAALYSAAADWFAAQGYVEEALDHYLQADDIAAAVNLISGIRYSLLNETRWQRLAQYFGRFAPESVVQFPQLLILKLWLTYHLGQYAGLSPILAQLETILSRSTLSPQVVLHLHGEMATLYALLAYLQVQPQETITQAEFALENTPPVLWIVRSLARTVLAGARQMSGDLVGAYAEVYNGLAEEQEQSNHFKSTLIQITGTIGWIAADMERVMQAGRQIIELSRHNPSRQIQGIGRYHLGCAHYQKNNLSSAEAQFAIVCRQPYLSYGEYYVYSAIGLAQIYLAQGQPTPAEVIIKDLFDYLIETNNTFLMPVVQGFQAEFALRNNHLPAAEQWAAQFQEPPPPEPVFRHYTPHLTLARIWLAQDEPAARNRAGEFLAQLHSFAQLTHNTCLLLQVLAVQALLHEQIGEADEAQTTLRQALNLARPGGLLRTFVDLGPPMAYLLNRIMPAEADLQAFIMEIQAAFAAQTTATVAANGHFLAALTNREIDILFLLADRKTNKEIAQDLVISENTVRFHLKNIYAKLDVHNRREAAVRARQLGIIIPG
jgi:LuxR family maltose regulon positive regulatory protein